MVEFQALAEEVFGERHFLSALSESHPSAGSRGHGALSPAPLAFLPNALGRCRGSFPCQSVGALVSGRDHPEVSFGD